MSEENAQGTPATSQESVQQPPTPAATPTGEQQPDPKWLDRRLEQHERTVRARVLAELGVNDPKAAKALLDEAKVKSEAEKTAAQRLTEREAAYQAVEADRNRQATILQEFAARQLLGLTEDQQAAVKRIAGDDAARQLETITALSPTWAKPAPLPTNGAATPAPKPVGSPAGTAPAPSAPSGATTSPTNEATENARLREVNPILAARHGLRHIDDVHPTKN